MNKPLEVLTKVLWILWTILSWRVCPAILEVYSQASRALMVVPLLGFQFIFLIGWLAYGVLVKLRR